MLDKFKAVVAASAIVLIITINFFLDEKGLKIDQSSFAEGEIFKKVSILLHSPGHSSTFEDHYDGIKLEEECGGQINDFCTIHTAQREQESYDAIVFRLADFLDPKSDK